MSPHGSKTLILAFIIRQRGWLFEKLKLLVSFEISIKIILQ
jgi:hypothetical protein